MPTTYTKPDASDSVYKTVANMMKKYHDPLLKAKVSVDVVFASNSDDVPIKRHGVPCSAQVKIVGLKDRAKGNADAEIVIDLAVWNKMAEPERDALIDHELEHLELKEKKGKVVRDDLGRPKFKMRSHDWEVWGFRSIVERHKDAAIDTKAVMDFIEGPHGQFIMSFAARG